MSVATETPRVSTPPLRISSGTARYTTWFGTYSASRRSIVQSRLRLIGSHKFSTFTCDCTCTAPGIDAYTCVYIF